MQRASQIWPHIIVLSLFSWVEFEWLVQYLIFLLLFRHTERNLFMSLKTFIEYDTTSNGGG